MNFMISSGLGGRATTSKALAGRVVSGSTNSASSFANEGWVLIERAISNGDSTRYGAYALMNQQHAGFYVKAPAQPMFSRYADALGESLLRNLQQDVEAATGLELLPISSELSLCMKGVVEAARVENAAHEVSAIVALESVGAKSWPLRITVGDERRVVSLQPGHMLVYRGNQLECERDAFGGDVWVQFALRYVNANGEHVHHRFDGRRSLGVPLHRAEQDEVISRRKVFDAALAAGDDQPCFCGSAQHYSACHGIMRPQLSA